MKHLFLLALACILAPAAAHAQGTPAPAATPAAAPAPTVPESAQEAILPSGVVAPAAKAPTATSAANATLIAPAPETPAADPNAIKVKAESAAGRLTVKTDNPGPTRVEVTDVGGRPVLTHTMMNGQTPLVLNVSKLPAGAYIVRCTAYEKTGMRRVKIGM
ncbi:T9SS type A sorting domain-containing protein [Hymenobacter arizonensis]|uniref:Por secretion system C-terminal sorting domain-containing protein n=1 Tax=Hymenobacter arizonensis TaxID=1227077 RepID=A0A1I5XH37_HYMAR|nr:T9SS type A sorting domain-containing protein [Hymenobacter arizonensis]SFQ31275.1 Por secretion system C-terminal sorting domain-containing protein [Hymenobacter arizonensis]